MSSLPIITDDNGNGDDSDSDNNEDICDGAITATLFPVSSSSRVGRGRYLLCWFHTRTTSILLLSDLANTISFLPFCNGKMGWVDDPAVSGSTILDLWAGSSTS